VLVSDTESWVYKGRAHAYGSHGSTGVMTEWQQFVQNQQTLGGSRPKLICIDLQPVTTTQAPDRGDVLNVGGFSDAVFSVVASFLDDDANRFVSEVEAIEP
jgi:60 kDa SS-A/Ro ribonucleoprotein